MPEQETSSRHWFYMSSDKQIGPIDSVKMRKLISSGEIGRDTLVWFDGSSSWRKASDSELSEMFTPPPLPIAATYKCVECGTNSIENAGTVENPLCRSCYNRMLNEHADDKVTEVVVQGKFGWITKTIFVFIGILGILFLGYLYDKENGGNIAFAIFHKKSTLELVRKSKMIKNVLVDKSVEDFTKERAEEGAQKGKQYEWTAKPAAEEPGFAIVGFIEKGTTFGLFWEVDLKNKIVRYINSNVFLSMKYGFSRLNTSGDFKITEVTLDTLKYIKYWVNREATWSDMIYDTRRVIKDKIVYYYRGSITNNTDKVITDASIKCHLYLIFNVDKIVEIDQFNSDGFATSITPQSPWKPGESRKFRIEMDPIEGIYRNYNPSKVFFELNLSASDPIGYEFDWVIRQHYLSWNFTE